MCLLAGSMKLTIFITVVSILVLVDGLMFGILPQEITSMVNLPADFVSGFRLNPHPNWADIGLMFFTQSAVYFGLSSLIIFLASKVSRND